MDGDESSEPADDEGGQSGEVEPVEPAGSPDPDDGPAGPSEDSEPVASDDSSEPRDTEDEAAPAADRDTDDSTPEALDAEAEDGSPGDVGDGEDDQGADDSDETAEPVEADGSDEPEDDEGAEAEGVDVDGSADDEGEDADEEGDGEGTGPDSETDEEDDAVGTFRGNPALDGRTGPEDDREMPLTEHIEEMLKRLAVVVAVAGVVSLAVFPLADQVINFLWYSILPGVETEIAQPRVYALLELWFTRIKVASLAGLVVALPVLVYETYAFMRPGLYPHERRYYLAAVPTSLVLAIVGVSFAYFVVLPAIFVYFLYYSQDVATIGFALGRTFDLILLMMGYLAVVFQIPLFLMLAMMMGLVTRRWLADRRLLFWGAFLGISFLFGFDPTGMAPILVAATMIVLFEGTLLLTKWTGRE